MKILNKIIEFVKALVIKLRKPVHLEVHETSEKKVEEKPVENVTKPVEPVEKTEKTDKPVEAVKTVKRRGRPRKTKAE